MNVELLRKVKRHILAEPKRFNMDYSLRLSSESPCGTVGCIAGWVAVLNGDISTNNPLEFGWDNVRKIASKALGIGLGPALELFSEHKWPRELYEAFHSARSRTKRAKVAAQAIEHFIRTKGRE